MIDSQEVRLYKRIESLRKLSKGVLDKISEESAKLEELNKEIKKSLHSDYKVKGVDD